MNDRLPQILTPGELAIEQWNKEAELDEQERLAKHLARKSLNGTLEIDDE